jgi:hypothetical protein
LVPDHWKTSLIGSPRDSLPAQNEDHEAQVRTTMPARLGASELQLILDRSEAASPPPWTAIVEGRDQTSGASFILVGQEGRHQIDLYVSYEFGPTPSEDLDFIAHARDDIPRVALALATGQVGDLVAEELEDMSDRARRASPEPWVYAGALASLPESDLILVGDAAGRRMHIHRFAGVEPLPLRSDLEFIAHARQDLPRLLLEVADLRTEA